MYYCLKCDEYHTKQTAITIFKTGFRSDCSDQDKVPLGICIYDKVSENMISKLVNNKNLNASHV